ncbi:hypothetical protein ACF0H5_022544 [Mactra antiquata]
MKGVRTMVLNSFIIFIGFNLNIVCGQYYSAYTDAGTIIGTISDVYYRRAGYKIVSFLGIPYTEEASRRNRFEKLELREPFKKPYNATYFRAACLQAGPGASNQNMAEDCLNLNIYAPAESTINPRKKFPVIIYIHDGNFKVGTGSDVSPEILCVAGDLIVVTVNYRLGVFGFLSSASGIFASGNYGLWDQHLAIRWVRYNIAAFGGDFKNITLMGQAVGAASVMYQSLYTGNRGLFQRIIAISGTILSPWALHGPNLREVAREIGCLNNGTLFSFSDEPIVNCVRNMPVPDILKTGSVVGSVGPTVDGEFLVAHPYDIVELKNNSFLDAHNFFRSIDIVLGFNSDDGTEALGMILQEDTENEVILLPDEFEHVIIPGVLEPIFRKHELYKNYTINTNTRNIIKQSTIYQYTNWTDPYSSKSVKQNLKKLTNDVNFVIPIVEVADRHSYTNINASTYVYKFEHRPSYKVRQPGSLLGAGMESQTLFIFGFPRRMMTSRGLTNADIPNEEFRLSDVMMQWVANFVHTGNPNKPHSIVVYTNNTNNVDNFINSMNLNNPQNVVIRTNITNQFVLWPKYTDERPYLLISTNMSSRTSPRIQFGEPATSYWTNLVPVLLQGAKPAPRQKKPELPVYTAFRIQSAKVEVVITSLILVCCGFVVISILLIICACRQAVVPDIQPPITRFT